MGSGDHRALAARAPDGATRNRIVIGSDSGADSYRMRRAQNRRSQFTQRYCLIDTNLNNLSSKSRRRERLIRSLLQSGHVITRKCLYSLIGRSKYPNSAYVVPSDETSIRACINPQILSLRRIAPGWGSAIIVRGCDSLVPVANVALRFSDFARSVKNFSRRCSHCWASSTSVNHLCPSNEWTTTGLPSTIVVRVCICSFIWSTSLELPD